MTSLDVHAEQPDLASLGALLAHRTRAAICLALLDGRAWTALEVARLAGVAPSTATSHLNWWPVACRLRSAGADTAVCVWRTPGIAEMIEALAARAPRRLVPVRSLSAARRHRAVGFAASATTVSTAYSPVAMTDAMTARGLLSWESGPALTASGAAWLADLGIATRRWGRRAVRMCVRVWTGRSSARIWRARWPRPCSTALEASWLVPGDGSRVVRLTDHGRDAFRRYLGLADEALTTG